MVTKEIIEVSTGEFADINPSLGKSGNWADFALFEGSFKNFSDIPEDQLPPGQMQPLVKDIEKAMKLNPSVWQAPSWNLFAYACEKQRPISIVTARGHSPETIKEGIKVLIKYKQITKEPEYLSILPVGNNVVRVDELGDNKLEMTTPSLKKRAIIKTVDMAMAKYGLEPDHRFGMSDDDPKNIELIIAAMCVCKKKYINNRFFVINTHMAEMVKLEVFPINVPATHQIIKHNEEIL